jgi:hypothetical protein
LCASLLSGVRAQTIDPTAKSVEKLSSDREYKRLCQRAKAADDYRALGDWCDGRSSFCARRVKELEADLNAYYTGMNRVGPKYPPRDQTLKELIYHYRVQRQKWTERGEGHKKQLAQLTGAGALASAQAK